jgi:small subunit ribosomal protein S8e
MAIVHTKDLKKTTGGRRRHHRKKKKADIGRPFVPVTVGEETRKNLRVRGGHQKVRMLQAGVANLAVGRKIQHANIKRVVENPSNPFFVRRNIITRGSIIETDKGYARVTSRPGQDGHISAVLLKDYVPAKKARKSRGNIEAKKSRETGKSREMKKRGSKKVARSKKVSRSLKK